MADIDIERRDSASWLWWVLGLILVGLVAYLLASSMMGDDEVAVEDPVAAPVATEPMPQAEPIQPERPAAVQQFVQTCAERQPSEMGLDHQYTASCTRDLISALTAVVPQTEIQSAGLTTELEEAREATQRLQESATDETQHASMTRNAFTSIADVFEGLQADRYPELQTGTTDLRSAAESVEDSGMLLEQREAVQDFFARAGNLLDGISTAATNPTASSVGQGTDVEQQRPATVGGV